MKNTIVAIWKPAWYELDQSIAIGEIGQFDIVEIDGFIKFTTLLEQGEEVKVRILKIYNSELGEIIKIKANDLTYKFYTDETNFYDIEAEETPGMINGDKSRILRDTTFSVTVELL